MDTSNGTGEDPAAILKEWRKAEQAATPGPLEAVTDDHGRRRLDHSVWSGHAGYYLAEAVRTRDDAEFIVTARTAMPVLLAALEAVLKLPAEWRQESEALRDAAGKVWEDAPDAPGVRLKHAYAAGYAECAKALEAAITAALAGTQPSEDGDHA